MVSDAVPVEIGRRVVDCDETGTTFRLPRPIDRRLDQLVGLARSAGHAAHRKDVVAALICAAPVDPEKLAALLVESRTATVGDVVLGVRTNDKVVSVPRHGPGRRRARSG